MTKVSVIIPFYNQSQDILEKAVFSALNQTMNDIELICIDDGSTDTTCFTFLNNLKIKDSRIKLYTKKHSGSGDARNLGIKNSSGENIMFLDSDDYYPNVYIFEKLYNLKKHNNVLIAGGKHLILNNNSFEEPYFNYGNINDFFCNKKVKYKDYQFPWWYWCFMFESSLIKDNNIYFPPYLRYQDPPFFVRVMNKAEYFYAANFITYIHRNSDKLFSLDEQKAFHHVMGIANLLEYSNENNLDKLHNLLYNTFFSYDIKIIENIKELSTEQKRKLESIIIQASNKNKIK